MENMKNLWNKYSRNELLKRIGNLAQIGGTRHYTLDSGLAKNTRAVDVNTGSGLRFTILPDRAMDISLADYKGINLIYLTCNGETHPAFFEPEGAGWLRTCAAGLLTTCGLTYLGPPCIDGNDQLGLHGRISTMPAKQFSDNSGWDGEKYKIELTGIMEEGCLFGDKIRMTRTFTNFLGEKRFTIQDKIENFGFKESPFTILYHINIGFPLLDASSELFLTRSKTEPRDKHASAGIDSVFSFSDPIHGFYEQVYYHTVKAAKDGTAHAAVINKNLENGLGLYLKFKPEELPYMTEWKMTGEGEYVTGMEPCNVPCKDRTVLREEGLLPMLKPGEVKTITLEIGILEGKDEIRVFCA